MKSKSAWLLLFLLGQPGFLLAEFSWTPTAKSAYAHIWAYKLKDARQEIDELSSSNSLKPFLQSMADAMELTITEDKALKSEFFDQATRRHYLIGRSDRESPWHFYCRAEMYMHQALVYARFGDYLRAANDAQKAHALLKSGIEQFPKFLPLQKDMLAMQAAIGTVPDSYRPMLQVLGFSGELEGSMAAYTKMLAGLKANPEWTFLGKEATILYSGLQNYLLNDPKQAWASMKEATADYKSNLISAMVRTMMGNRLHRTAEVLDVLNTHIDERPLLPMADFVAGQAKLFAGEQDAGYYLARFLQHYKGESYLKDGYLRLGWAYLLIGDTTKYKASMRLVKHYGNTRLEEDKQALYESQQAELPNVHLLRARLRSDGGYYSEALAELNKVNDQSLSRTRQAELLYRKGRVLAALGRKDEAVDVYRQLMSKFTVQEGYFVPAACFYTAEIEEARGNMQEAIRLYRQCLSYKGYIYKDAFDQRAKAGLGRLQ